jgi:hypothetical protein
MGKGLAFLVLGMLLGSALMAAWGALAGNESAPAVAAPGDSARLLAIDTELQALRALIERQGLRALPAAASAPVPLAAPDDPRLDDVLARLDALSASVAALGQRVDAMGQAWAGEAKSVARSEPMPESLPEGPPNVSALESLRGRSIDDLTQQHLLWTYDQVNAAYGRPTKVRPSPGGVGIKYAYEFADGSTFIVWFVGGKVVGAFW